MKLRGFLIGFLIAGAVDAFLTPAVARSAGLRFVSPRPNEVVGGDYVLLWAAETPVLPTAREAQPKERPVVFEASADNRTFVPLPRQTAPDYGLFSHTSAFDSTAFPSGLLFLRVRYANQKKGPTIRVRVNRPPEVDCQAISEIPGGLTAFFDCSGSRDPDGRIVLYIWHFGDGTSLETREPRALHTFASAGTYPLEIVAVDDSGLSSTLRRLVEVISERIGLVPANKCGCKKMVVTAKGTSTLNDPRRKAPGPLGRDPAFVSFNFEVLALLEPGSDPALCAEGQLIKSTNLATAGPFGASTNKLACVAGNLLPKCAVNADCDNSRCTAKPHELCNDAKSMIACKLRGGTCVPQGDGVCKPFPFSGKARGNDDYRRAGDLGVKAYGPGPVIRWFDAPGTSARHTLIGFDFRFGGDFLMFVNGTNGGGSCQCHVQMFLDWDNKRQVYGNNTGIHLIGDGETSANCSISR